MEPKPQAVGRSILPSANKDWLALHQEPIIDPAQPIIDPHHHLWNAPRERYLLDELEADCARGHNIIATIFAECTEGYLTTGPEHLRSAGETAFAAQIGQEADARNIPHGICAGIISYADLRQGAAVEEVLDAHLKAGAGRFRGIRQSTAWDRNEAVRTTIRTPPEGVLREPVFREGFAVLTRMGLTFDSWVYHPQLSDVADLARAFPGANIILDHVGGPIGIGPYAGMRDEVLRVWEKGIRDIASCQNVTVKLGGLGMRLGGFGFHELPRPPSSDDLAAAWKPYVETCIDAFGPARCMFESNFPVDEISCGYDVLWNAFKRLAAGGSADEKDDLFWRTASRVYRISAGSAYQADIGA